jgi:RNA polymerase sigma-70 factor (ECF subfamily)
LHATRAELLRRLGRDREARDAYERALGLVHAEPERRFLERRLAELSEARLQSPPADPARPASQPPSPTR